MNTQTEILAAQKDAFIQMEQRMISATRTITKEVEAKLVVDFKVVEDAMYTIQQRLHNLETVPIHQPEGFQLQMAEEMQNITKSVIAMQHKIHSIESMGMSDASSQTFQAPRHLTAPLLSARSCLMMKKVQRVQLD